MCILKHPPGRGARPPAASPSACGHIREDNAAVQVGGDRRPNGRGAAEVRTTRAGGHGAGLLDGQGVPRGGEVKRDSRAAAGATSRRHPRLPLRAAQPVPPPSAVAPAGSILPPPPPSAPPGPARPLPRPRPLPAGDPHPSGPADPAGPRPPCRTGAEQPGPALQPLWPMQAAASGPLPRPASPLRVPRARPLPAARHTAAPGAPPTHQGADLGPAPAPGSRLRGRSSLRPPRLPGPRPRRPTRAPIAPLRRLAEFSFSHWVAYVSLKGGRAQGPGKRRPSPPHWRRPLKDTGFLRSRPHHPPRGLWGQKARAFAADAGGSLFSLELFFGTARE